jgi:hypothetical protein
MQVTETGVPVASLIDAVKTAIAAARISNIDSDRPMRVSEIQLTLNAMATNTSGAKLEFKIPFIGMNLSMGTSVTSTDTHEISITMVPPDLATPGYEIRGADVDQVIADAVETIATVTAHAAGGNDPFLLNDSTIELAFAVTSDGRISLGATGEFKDEVTHKLKVTLVASS